ncbi:bifunctional diguanylate cyclase/phosphodiesterase [Alkalihalobacillus sp. BA299]|uniref:putative bifunctional diguanylate cyclase/phosphodiesterase n=1 Tax=Alkalihalobacillus sp. BA299 TaxID=2815938 RepID=UPI001ADA03FE|nr:EAL domain-containing protein [Alkalihalobacillus sp. BA299]
MPVVKGWAFVLVTSAFFYQILKQNIKSIEESEERYRRLVERSPETILVHIMGKIVYINNAGVRLLGARDLNGIIGKHILDFIPQKDREETKKRIINVQERVERELVEQKILLPNGQTVFVEIIAFKTNYHGKEAVQVIVRDISERKKAEASAHYLAYYDTITGLANRNLLNKHINKMLAQAKRNNQKMAVMFLDLDRFKIINDTLGHAIGDSLLKEVSKRLKRCLPDDDIIARYGGDEFIILRQNTTYKDVSNIAQGIVRELSSPLMLNGNQLFISPSIGISIYPNHGDSVDALIKNADMAMYMAKENGGNNYCFYDSALSDKNKQLMKIETGLRKALENDEFQLLYQPQVDLETGKLVGAEALIRWESSEYEMIPPMEFIPVAEKIGLIIPIGEWVLETACKQNKRWQEEGCLPIRIAVNVSVRQLQQSSFIETVKYVLEKTELDPAYLELEITESVVQNIEEAASILDKLKSLGIHISLDDFGTGYSSLSYIRHLPIDKLKIDKSFVDDITDYSSGRAIVKTIIDMGNNLNFKVIAEGIETEQQFSFLKQNNCHYGQGYFFSKPVSAEEMTNVIVNLKEGSIKNEHTKNYDLS